MRVERDLGIGGMVLGSCGSSDEGAEPCGWRMLIPVERDKKAFGWAAYVYS